MIASLRRLAADPKLRQFALYAICGGTGVVTDLTLYSALVWAGWNYQLANALGYAAGTLISFVLNRHFTFKAYDKTLRRLGLFAAAAFIGYLTSTALLWLLVAVLGVNAIIAKLATLAVVLILQFSLNRAITFRSSADEVRP